ncbi:MAG: hypothetical protein HYZ74_05575, partial [Elusimicrobia bacterium]|nr:hypothetical protein [Elusimicrobiota bacterium]
GERGADRGLPFDADLWRKPPEEAAARIRELAGMAGGLQAEIAATKEHATKLMAELGDTRAKLERLKALSRPVTDAERAEHDRLLRELTAKSDEVAVREKLAERRDLLNPPSDADDLARLEALQKKYQGLLPPPPPDRNGYWENLAAQDASMKALASRLKDYAEGRAAQVRADGPVPTLDPVVRDRIAVLVAEIEAMRAETKAELAQRDAVSQLLAASNKTRNHALRERNPSVNQRFHTDMAKLASVMDLALSLNEINAAQAAIKQLMDLLEAKRVKIGGSRLANQANQASAAQTAALVSEWRASVDRDIASDASTASDIAESEAKAGMAVQRFTSFQTDVRDFINQVNAQDSGASVDAAAEYQRRIDLLPQIKQWRINGKPGDPDAFSLKDLNDDLTEIDDNVARANKGLEDMRDMPTEYAGTLIPLVPGPRVVANSPSLERVREILSERRTHWTAKRADFKKSLDNVEELLGLKASGNVVDDFGDSHPKSLPAWRAATVEGELAPSQAATRQYLAQLDVLAGNINRATGARIPMLSGLSLKQLQDAIKNYGDDLKTAKFPDADTLESHAAQMDLITAAKLVPYAAREVIRWSKADGTVTAIDEALNDVLPKARNGLGGVVSMLDEILADVDADEAWIANPPPSGNAGVPGRQALIDRKSALLREKILPALQAARAMLVDTLIPYQTKSANEVSGPDSDYFKLYDAKKRLITESVKLYNRTMPWALATWGAEDGDQAEAARKIAEWRHKLQKNLDGYDDAEGHHKGVHEYQVEIANRKDPNFSGPETTEHLKDRQAPDGAGPYSLPRKITMYTAERAQRADQLNAQDAEINEILGKIEARSQGKYNLAALRLPVGVTADVAGVSRVQTAVDAHKFQNLGDELERIADEAQAEAASIEIGDDDGTVPTGVQPPITLADNQQIALWCLDAAKRLVPTSLDRPDSAVATFAAARFLYADGTIEGAEDALRAREGKPNSGQIPKAEEFLGLVSQTLGDAIADIPRDEAYAASNGTTETADQVYARKIRVYSSLDAMLLKGVEFFQLKQQWNQDSFKTIDRVKTYYDSLHDIYEGGQTANDSEITALDKMEEALRKTMTDLEDKRQKVASWLNQLNPKEKSVLNNIGEDVSLIMEKTRAVLEANINWHELKGQLTRSRDIVQAQLTQIDEKQSELSRELASGDVQGQLPPDLVRRIEALRLGRGAWAAGGDQNGPASLVIRKSEFGAFIDTLIGLMAGGTQNSLQNLSAIKADLLKNPQAISSFIPTSKVLDFGDTADGFYL